MHVDARAIICLNLTPRKSMSEWCLNLGIYHHVQATKNSIVLEHFWGLFFHFLYRQKVEKGNSINIILENSSCSIQILVVINW